MSLPIGNAQILDCGQGDLRIRDGRIAAIGRLTPRPGERVVDAAGGALLPGLHDHHIHLSAQAAKRASVLCGPPEVRDGAGLAAALRTAPGHGWVRGIGYHESVLGTLPDARTIDGLVRDRPVRIQHRSGRMWMLNSLALDTLLAGDDAPPGLEQAEGRYTGRLFDEDAWLQRAMRATPPDLSAVSADLARYGITGVTDMSPRNDPVLADHFASQRASGALRQTCVLAGSLALAQAEPQDWRVGPAKLHLHESALPPFDEAVAFVRAAHAQERAVAVHCVSEVELVFALAAIETGGSRVGDRIEHVSVAAPALLDNMAALDLQACVQPHFIHERGDRYLVDVEPRHRPDLYRLQSLSARGIALAGGSDAPYGSIDPWMAMAAAVDRRTASGASIGPDEALDPEQALSLYLADASDLTRRRRIAVDAPADLCLLDRPWQAARRQLDSAAVAATVIAGELVYQRVHQAPVPRQASADPPA